jgi:hypothetical protein
MFLGPTTLTYSDKSYRWVTDRILSGKSVMQKPDLDRMWETFVRLQIEPGRTVPDSIFSTIRTKIPPLISSIDGLIDWYCFLVHGKHSGVPTTENDGNAYFHIRVSLKQNAKPDDFLESLPTYCLMTRKVEREWVKDISIGEGTKFDTSLLKDEKIEEVWRIIGEQSEWLLNMLSIYRDDVQIPLQHIGQWFHYFFNMTGLSIVCPNCRNPISI